MRELTGDRAFQGPYRINGFSGTLQDTVHFRDLTGFRELTDTGPFRELKDTRAFL